MNKVFKTVLRLAILAPLLTNGAVALAEEPVESGTLTLEYTFFGVGVGVSKGGGMLTLKNGAQYEFTFEGANIGVFGVGKVHAAGRIYNLAKVEDFSGGYAAIGAGIAIIAGPGVSNLKNQRNDVRLVLQSTVEGLAIGLGGAGITIALGRMTKGPDPTPREPKNYTLYFDFNSIALNQSAKNSVAEISDEWKGYSAKVTIVGHTDTAGPKAYNQNLSEKRALTVQRTLVENGIPAFRLSSRGMGESKLAVRTPDNVANQLNRRVAISFD